MTLALFELYILDVFTFVSRTGSERLSVRLVAHYTYSLVDSFTTGDAVPSPSAGEECTTGNTTGLLDLSIDIFTRVV